MRQLNIFTPQALAGVVEDLELSYDLVDGTVNPTDVKTLPFTLNGSTYTANQIRKVNVHIGVRSETMSTQAARLPPQSSVDGREPAKPGVRRSVQVGLEDNNARRTTRPLVSPSTRNAASR